MSLTNPNKVVTEERLAEFYGQLLPYLGGMPEAVVNKFSKSDLYSTTEKIVGCWTDGKPIYQKTIVDTLPTVTTDGTVAQKFVSVGALVDEFVSINVMVKSSNGINSFNISSWGSVTTSLLCSRVMGCTDRSEISSEKNTLRIQNYKISHSGFPVIITIKYTKTTDAANSFNFSTETDYSTTEKIIGTWIDGKPLYQKSFNVSLPNGDSENYTPIGANVDRVIEQKCSLVSSSNGLAVGFSTVAITNSTFGTTNNGIKVVCYNNTASSNANSIHIKNSNANSWASSQATLVVTLQYTKTTD